MEIEQIRTVKKAVETRLLKRAGVTGVGIGYKRTAGQKTDTLAIQVFVERKRDVPARQTIPPEIQGVKTDVIQGKMVSHPLRKPVAEIEAVQDVKIYDPLFGGISIGPCREIGGFVFAGTLGTIVTDNTTGDPLLLSNYHVLAVDEEGEPGDEIAQPSLIDGGECPEYAIGEFVRGHFGDNVDCAVTSRTNRGTSCEIAEIGVVTGIGEAVLGMPVKKRGRTTVLTYGIVDSIDLTVRVDYEGFLETTTFRNQIGIIPDTDHNTIFGLGGDSGSVVVDNENRIVGLYFAGDEDGDSGVANPIQLVLDALDISVCTS